MCISLSFIRGKSGDKLIYTRKQNLQSRADQNTSFQLESQSGRRTRRVATWMEKLDCRANPAANSQSPPETSRFLTPFNLPIRGNNEAWILLPRSSKLAPGESLHGTVEEHHGFNVFPSMFVESFEQRGACMKIRRR